MEIDCIWGIFFVRIGMDTRQLIKQIMKYLFVKYFDNGLSVIDYSILYLKWEGTSEICYNAPSGQRWP